MGLQDFYEKRTPFEKFTLSLQDLSDKTRKSYTMFLTEFCKNLGNTPDELFALESENQASTDGDKKIALRLAFEAFRTYLIKEKKLNPNTARNYRKALNKFLIANGLNPLPSERGKSVGPKAVKSITKDRIRELLNYAGNKTRLRALILTAKDTGLRVSDLAQLTIEYFNSMQKKYDDQGREFRFWSEPLTTKKTGGNAHLCLGPESIEALKNYIGSRESGPIFTSNMNSRGGTMRITRGPDRGKEIPREGSKAGQALKGTAITNVFINHSKPLRDRGIRVTAHSFRKFFLNAWTVQGLKDFGKLFAGKSLGPNDGAYIDRENGNLETLYKEHYDKVLGLMDTRTAIELKETRDEVSRLKLQMEQMQKDFILVNRNQIPFVIQALGNNQLEPSREGSISPMDWMKENKRKR